MAEVQQGYIGVQQGYMLVQYGYMAVQQGYMEMNCHPLTTGKNMINKSTGILSFKSTSTTNFSKN